MSHERFDIVWEKYSKLVYIVSLGAPAFLIIIMFAAVADAVCTKLFGFSIRNTYALIQYFSIPSIYLSAASVQMTRGHTNMALFLDKMPPAARIICKILAYALGFCACLLMSRGAFSLLLTYIQQGKTTAENNMGGIVLWPFVLCFLLCYLLLAGAFILCLVKACIDGVNREKPDPKSGGDQR